MTCGVILLAAGNSIRFGSDKREALVNNIPLLLYTVQQYTTLSCPILVVVNQTLSLRIKTSLTSLTNVAEVIVMPEPGSGASNAGMGDSLATAAKAASELGWDAALIGLADMPFIKPDTLLKLFRNLPSCNAVVPVFEGRWGHPVGFQKHYFSELALLGGDRGGRTVLKFAHPLECKVNDPGVLWDIDTPEQLNNFIKKDRT